MLRDDDLGATFIHFGDDRIAVEGFVGDQAPELDAVDQRSNAYSVVAVSAQELEANAIAERVGESEDFGGPAAFGTTYA
jgi:hypothetical protein